MDFPGITGLWESITLLGDSFTLFLFMLLFWTNPRLIKTAALGALLTADSNLLKASFAGDASRRCCHWNNSRFSAADGQFNAVPAVDPWRLF